MYRVIEERYRCPDQIAESPAIPPLSTADRPSRFESDSSSYTPSSSLAADLPANLTAALIGSQPALDPDRLVSSFTLERYLGRSHGTAPRGGPRHLWSELYYCVRPFLPNWLRIALQRLYLHGWRRIGFPAWPLDVTVERLVESSLLQCMKGGGIAAMPFIWFWPDGASSAAILTHDVETVRGRDFCHRLMDIDESFGFHSSYQIVPERRYPVTTTLLQEIRDRGHEVNVQDLNHDGRLFADRHTFLSRVQSINEYGRAWGAKGFRSAILYRNLDWYDALEFEYDMSVPNVAHLDPQRGGCCTVFPYLVGNILELPLTTIQDYSLFHILRQRGIDLWKKQSELVMEKHGLLSFIVHPDYLVDHRAQSAYRDLLAFLVGLRSERKLWVALPNQVNEWWRQRSKMTLVPHGNTWRVQGTGHERARIAYARIEGNRLVYAIESAVPAAT